MKAILLLSAANYYFGTDGSYKQSIRRSGVRFLPWLRPSSSVVERRTHNIFTIRRLSEKRMTVESTLRLFKALPVESKTAKKIYNELLLVKTVPMGFLFAPEVLASYPDTSHLMELVDKLYGRDPAKLNASFHKSWAKVRDASIEQLVIEQLIHYLTTYGAEHEGNFDHDTVYIPVEDLEIPPIDTDKIRLVVIRGLTKDELKTELLKLLSAGVALSEETIADCIDVAQFVELTEDEVDLVKNKEVKAALYDYFGIVPSNPTEFLRYVVYRATNKTLLIKNRALTSQIAERDNVDVTRYFDIYEKEIGLASLGEIFYRYKPIFLAFRTNTKLRKTINRVRRAADSNHKPMPRDLLNDITSILKNKEVLDMDQFKAALSKANTFRKVRLAYALKFRTTNADSIMYRVRNGKSYATDFKFPNKTDAKLVYDVVIDAIANDITKNVYGKKIYIPEGMKYALPATEKQFTGNLPTGSYVDVKDDMVVGVWWKNVQRHRIDLDLSITNADGKIGWDGRYRDRENGIYFSGDLTNAPGAKGAAELFHIGREARGTWIMFVNYYNYQENVDVPFNIVVGRQTREKTAKALIDANDIVVQASSEMTVRQKNLGIIVSDMNGSRFYFAESELGKAISASGKDYAEQARKYLLNYYQDSIVLNDVLVMAGAELVTEATDVDIDLSPEAIDKTTILALLTETPDATTD